MKKILSFAAMAMLTGVVPAGVPLSTPIQTPAALAVTCAPGEWQADYFPNRNLTGTPVISRCETAIPDYNWGDGSPDPLLAVDNFSIRWTSSQNFLATSTRFTTVSDDGVRLYVDNVRQINNWTFHAPTTNTKTVNLSAGAHTIRLEYFEGGGGSQIKLSWTPMAPTAPQAPQITSFTANPGAVTAGQSSTLSWTTTNASACTASNAWSGSKAVNGSEAVTPSATATYTLTCSNAGTSTTAVASVTVGVVPAPQITSFTATPASIILGETADLSWATQDAVSCTASGGWSGAKATAGTETVQPATTTVYTLTCENSLGQTTSAQTTVTVNVPIPAPQITSFTATPSQITAGALSTLAWTTADATSCTASGGWSGAKSPNGSQGVQPTATTTYTLTCANSGTSTAVASVTIGITPVPQPATPVSYVTTSMTYGPTASAPAASQTGDLMIVGTIAANPMPAPVGWTLIGSQAQVGPSAFTYYVGYWYRVKQAGDTSWTWSGSDATQVAVYRGASVTSPVVAASVLPHGEPLAAVAWTATLPDLVASGNGDAAHYQSMGVYHSAFTPPAGYTERADRSDSTTSGDRLSLSAGQTVGGMLTMVGNFDSGAHLHMIIRAAQ